MRSETALLHLLKKLQSLEASRDRQRIAESVVVAALEILEAHSAILHAVKPSPKGLIATPVAWAARGGISSITEIDSIEAEDTQLSADPLLQVCAAAPDGMAADVEAGDVMRFAFAIHSHNATVAIFDAQCEKEPSEALTECVRELLNIYAEHLVLLDYAELDTLTKLNNRKTFDENFDRFIAIAEEAQRRTTDQAAPDMLAPKFCWLGVVDIDKFKRINDNFGHLFGDEVLLRVAELMKKSFRGSDKLFRFGGEEFVILLRHVSAYNAHMVFDRFRQAVEEHEFPQVGQVTCSLGYVQIDPTLTPAEILGRADESLYFCKDNGRNQIARYEVLIQKGLIEAPVAPAANEDLQADIDALFD